jgi:transcriptional regulator GlxA family with amidase domain
VHAGSHPATTDARILDVLEVLARDLEKPQSVKHFAAQLRLSASRFEHLFKDQTGLTFEAFLLAARMTKAKKMLKDRTLRIKEVAAAVGYANVSNFTRDYAKRYGDSPSQSRSSSLHDSLIPFSSRRGLRGGGP